MNKECHSTSWRMQIKAQMPLHSRTTLNKCTHTYLSGTICTLPPRVTTALYHYTLLLYFTTALWSKADISIFHKKGLLTYLTKTSLHEKEFVYLNMIFCFVYWYRPFLHYIAQIALKEIQSFLAYLSANFHLWEAKLY